MSEVSSKFVSASCVCVPVESDCAHNKLSSISGHDKELLVVVSAAALIATAISKEEKVVEASPVSSP